MSSLFGATTQAAGSIITSQAQATAGTEALQLGQQQQAALNIQATQDLAVGSQQAAEAALETKYTLGTVQARAAATGGSATSPTVTDVSGAIAARGEYSALNDLYTAGQKAQGLQYQGQLAAYSGQIKDQAAQIQSGTTLLTGMGTLAAKYGDALFGSGLFDSSSPTAGTSFGTGASAFADFIP